MNSKYLAYFLSFIISFQILFLEISSGRFSKLMFGLHFQGILISLAVAGLGFSGLFIYKLLKSNKGIKLLIFTFLITIFILNILFILFIKYYFILNTFFSKFFFFLILFLIYFLYGSLFIYLFDLYSKNIIKLNYFSILGSLFGGITVIFIFDYFGNLGVLYFFQFFSILISIFFLILINPIKRYKIIFYVLLIFSVLITFLILNKFSFFCMPNSIIDLKSNENYLFSYSNSISFLEIYSQNYSNRVVIDCLGDSRGYNKNSYVSLDNFTNNEKFTAIPFLLNNNNNEILILGSGLGKDVLFADLTNSKNISTVEINPLMFEILDTIFNDSENIYHSKNVNVYNTEIRNFLVNTDKKFDIIHLSSIKRYGGISSNSFVFLENFLYTSEAIEIYINKLNSNGLLYFRDTSNFIQRYLPTIIDYFLNKNISLNSKIILISENDYLTNEFAKSSIYIKPDGFSNKDIQILTEQSKLYDLKLEYLDNSSYNYSNKFNLITDDNPYYWNKKGFNFNYFDNDIRFMDVNILIYCILVLSLSLLTFYLFFQFSNKFNILNFNLFYLIFTLIGISEMFVQLNLINKFIVLIGNPILTIALVLSLFLFFNSLGNLVVDFLINRNINFYNFLVYFNFINFLFFLILIYFWNFIYYLFINSTVLLKFLFLSILLFIPGISFGFLFPVILEKLKIKNKDSISLFIGINSLAMVLGGLLAMLLSLYYGFNVVLIIGSFIYFISTLLLFKL